MYKRESNYSRDYSNYDSRDSYKRSYYNKLDGDYESKGYAPYRNSRYNNPKNTIIDKSEARDSYIPKKYYPSSTDFSNDVKGRYNDSGTYSSSRRGYNFQRNPYSSDYRSYSSRNYPSSSNTDDEEYDIESEYSGSGYISRNIDNEEELFSRPNTGINFDKYYDIKINVVGDDVPEPVNYFEDASLHTSILNNIKLSKYSKPTPVQKYALPIILNGRDLMASAQTGSGKTGGFLFPIIHGILTSHRSGDSTYSKGCSYPKALILAPTRELVLQILAEAQKFTYKTPVRPVCVYGGTPFPKQVREVERGCDIIIGTAGRLKDMVDRGVISLSKIQYLCLDEADRMLDMGFEPQIREIVEKRDMPPPNARRTMMFSATFPLEIQKLASDFLVKDYLFLKVGEVGSTSDNIVQIIKWVEDVDKNEALIKELRENPVKTLVFVETKKQVDILSRTLMHNGFYVSAIHGDRKQAEREISLHRFKTGKSTILIATSVAARGLDIEQVGHVINYELPGNIDDYVHRIGRTGRVGNIGKATAFYNEKNSNIAAELLKRLKQSKQEIPDWLYDQKKKSKGSKSNSYYRGGYGGYGGNRSWGKQNSFKPRWNQSSDNFDGVVGMPTNGW